MSEPKAKTSGEKYQEQPAKPKPVKQRDPQMEKCHAQVCHSFRNAEISKWKAHKEAQIQNSLLDNFVMDKTTLMEDMQGVAIPLKPPDPISHKDLDSNKGQGEDTLCVACDAMHVDGQHAHNVS